VSKVSPSGSPHAPLAIVSRGDATESVHYGSVAVVDAEGRLLFSAGDPEFLTTTRSALKPLQALPFVAGGGVERFGFSTPQVALLCASHSGEPRHVEAVSDMLDRIGCVPGQLLCGVHPPLYYAANDELPPAGAKFSTLHHNCSGKHSGMLATARVFGQSLGAALVAVVFAMLGVAAVTHDPTHIDTIRNAMPLALWMATAVAAVGAMVSALRLRPQVDESSPR